MVEIAPFRGVMYNSKEISDNGSRLIAPPYDVLSAEEQNTCIEQNPHNILRLDYGRSMPEDSHKYDWHQRSAVLLQQWLKEGVLSRLDKPAVFHLETTCNNPYKNEPIIRHGFVCLMKLEEFGPKSQVRPHEKTFSSHKEERLSLMKATGAQLSQIFGFFPDESKNVLSHMIRTVTGKKPILDFKDYRGIGHRMWLEQDERSLDLLKEMMEDRKVYIADGHHRYETALNYRQWIKQEKQEMTAAGCDYIMMYLCPMSDPGLVILPTHRLLNRCPFSPDEIINRLSRYFKISGKTYNSENEETIKSRFLYKLKKQKNSLGLSMSGRKAYYVLKLLEKAHNDTSLTSESVELATLDTVILSEIIFKEALGLTESDLDNPEIISYVSDLNKALNVVASGENKGAFILNPTTVEDILRVTEKKQVMPRKSTFFYPKVTTGLVFNLID